MIKVIELQKKNHLTEVKEINILLSGEILMVFVEKNALVLGGMLTSIINTNA